MDRDPQIIDLAAQDQIKWIDRGAIEQRVAVAYCAVILRDRVLALTPIDPIGVVAEAAGQRVIARAPREDIMRSERPIDRAESGSRLEPNNATPTARISTNSQPPGTCSNMRPTSRSL